MSELLRFPGRKRPHRQIFFSRREINQLLSLYSRKVARGEWRDYAIDHRSGMAVFSVFRHSQDRPLFAIAKCVGLQEPTADYLILSGRKRVATGASLDAVLGIFEEKLRVVS
jgi:uncharacterized protein DUF2794